MAYYKNYVTAYKDKYNALIRKGFTEQEARRMADNLELVWI